ncbi:MAG: hypothetical protein F4231_01640, partial [Acidimicrobiaceae bacterium]|nr:hypothetical protein [Acidimicrobiaceae bacterium]
MDRVFHSPTTDAKSERPAALFPRVIDVSVLSGNGAGGGHRSAATAEIESACTTDGLFLAAGHGIDGQLDAAFRAARAFFALPADVKDRVPRIDRYGYVPDRI